ncbi:Flagellar biosynthesis protein FliS [hydrothermal vent metagenome]|uniref:Flagellar biosynthesis protein FliS n=1 Tax=hydrothermal vent metagenome TaxID=652676 RepID=A0A3B0WSV9_9ZZZZ
MSYTTSKNSVSQYNSVNSYTGVTDANPHQLVQMLLDGALGKLSAVKGLIERNDTAKKGQVIGQAISIIGGLRSSLDMEKGGEIASNLDNVYEYMERQLVKANLKNDVIIIVEVVGLLREIKLAWESIPVDTRTKSPDLSIV